MNAQLNPEDHAPAVIAPVRRQVVVNASAERAFSLFTDGFGTWWPKSHTISPVPVEQAIIEPRAGGRCYDRATDGSECDWGQVLVWEPPARLVLAWQIDGTWSYEPDVEHASRVTVTFTPDGDRTEVTLVHDEFERHRNAGPELAAGVSSGWSVPLQAFAAAAETGPADTGPADTGPADTGPADAQVRAHLSQRGRLRSAGSPAFSRALCPAGRLPRARRPAPGRGRCGNP